MINIADIKGLKYPDEFVMRFFFKERLHENAGSVLELGCANGNNLMLFNQYGWDIWGFDISNKAIDDANYNFTKYGKENTRIEFIKKDLVKGILPFKGHTMQLKFDVILFPSILYYIPRKSVVKCLEDSKALIMPGGKFFVRSRTFGDYRYGRGEEVERNGFILKIAETGEKGLLNVFYQEHEMVNLLVDCLGCEISSLNVFRAEFDNIQQGRLINNSDVIIWGTI